MWPGVERVEYSEPQEEIKEDTKGNSIKNLDFNYYRWWRNQRDQRDQRDQRNQRDTK